MSTTSTISSRFVQVLRATLFLAVLFVATPQSAQAQTWLVSTDPYVKLGVLDKLGQVGAYTARFVVTNVATSKQYILVKEVERGQNGVDVLFPSEAADADYFKTDTGEAAKATPGRYVWECQVAGKKVVSGRFTMPEGANDVIIVDRR